ncbi:hypothetical protein Syun_001951 [Stephania yunnanensis]|uniref:Uncharacterized protein n=1 Tax=Stephania yunnanensis TaxID=152371 RepID=A0AAP0QBE7_9MAGN
MLQMVEVLQAMQEHEKIREHQLEKHHSPKRNQGDQQDNSRLGKEKIDDSSEILLVRNACVPQKRHAMWILS